MARDISSISRFGLTEPFELQVARGQITGHASSCIWLSTRMLTQREVDRLADGYSLGIQLHPPSDEGLRSKQRQ
jgi:hypothetical protein